jgi:hypothetical protein
VRNFQSAFAFALLLAAAPATHAGSFWDQFFDPDDGYLDMSQWLVENAAGFLPVPIVITEPAIGTGFGLAGVFFHPPDDDARDREGGGFPVTDISAAVGAYTTNSTWLAGGYHFNTMRQDTIRYTGFGGYGDIKAKYFGTEEIPIPEGVKFDVQGFMMEHELLFRVGDSNWFLGGDWAYSTSDATFDLQIRGLNPIGLDAKTSGLGGVALYEKTDSQFSPLQGATAKLEAQFNRTGLGSDFKFDQYSAELRSYFVLKEVFTVALRLDADSSNGDIPFYLEPYIELQGIPALRYQGRTAATAEVRAGWQFHPRFKALAFIGGGRTGETLGDLGKASTRTAQGAGFRYQVAKLLGMEIGLDVARGPEDTYYYLVTGSAW